MESGYPGPDLVGKMFVKQYYTTMHRDVSQLHRFYLEQSSFVHGGSEMGSEDPVIGQKNIDDKIKSLSLKQVHAKIKQVDSHATLGNGIVIQVTGELSTSGRPMRAFVQTFVLAPLATESAKKYYVHNDIFRYQDDDLAESDITDTAGEGEKAILMDEAPVESNGDYQAVSSSLSSSDGGKLVGGANQDLMMFSTHQPMTGEENTAMGETEPEAVRPNDEWEIIQREEVAHIQQNGLPENLESPPTAEEYPMEISGHVSTSAPAVEEQTMAVEYSPQELHKDQQMSWADRIAKQNQTQGNSQNRPLTSMTVSTSQALPQREPRQSRRGGGEFSKPVQPTSIPSNQVVSSGQGLTNTTGPSRESKKGPGNPFGSRDTPDACQIFVGGLPHQTTEAEIREAFKEYEPIKDIRVNPKNFAFVIFDSSDPVDRLIKTKETFIIRSKTLNIEPKKEKGSGPRGPGGYRGGDKFRAGGIGGGKPRPGGGGMAAAGSGRNPKR